VEKLSGVFVAESGDSGSKRGPINIDRKIGPEDLRPDWRVWGLGELECPESSVVSNGRFAVYRSSVTSYIFARRSDLRDRSVANVPMILLIANYK
jgi:hypothetical protein